MTSLELIPQSWLSWDFSVMQADFVVAEIKMSWWRDKGLLKVGGLHYAAYREGVMSGAFVLALDATQIARAEKPSWLSRSLTIKHGEKEYQLQAEWLGSSFFLLDNGQKVGSLVPRGVLTRKTDVSLPDELPMPVQIFVIWLTVVSRRSEADATA